MKHIIIAVCLIFISTSGALAQATNPNQTLEERITTLEQKVLELETQIKRLSGVSSPSNRPDGNTKTTTIDKPTDQEVTSAIATALHKSVPLTWAGNLMGGSKGVVKSLSIQQWGTYNEQYKYWPVKVRVVGTCEVDNLFSTETKSFDKVGDFKLKKDDYGKWIAEFVEQW